MSIASLAVRNAVRGAPVAQPTPQLSFDLEAYRGKYPDAVLDAAMNIFRSKPDQAAAFEQYGRDFDSWVQSFQDWWGAYGNKVSDKLDQFGPEMGLLDSLGLELDMDAIGKVGVNYDNDAPVADETGYPLSGENGLVTGTADTPVEQELFNRVYDTYVLPDLNADAQRQADAAKLLESYQPALDANRQLVTDLTATDANGNTAAYNRELAASQAAAAEQQAALDAQALARGQALTDAEAARTAALGAQLAARGQAISDAETAQLGALGTQLDELSANLTGELSARSMALRDQLAALQAGLGQYTAAERAALSKQIEQNLSALGAEVGAKREALVTELASLSQAVGEQDVARKAALEAELNKLTTAQQKVSDARIRSAEAQASAINLGVQSERDRITADMAQQGYVGSGSGTDAALLRASLAGRQAAAAGRTGAELLNAQDDQSLTRYGAGQERGISDETAGNRFSLAQYGAGEHRGLSDYDATGRRTIADFEAAQTRGISSADATKQLELNDYGAGANFELANYGAEQKRGLGDFGANQRRGISDTSTQSRLDLGNFGADQTRSIFDTTTQGRLDLGNFKADETRAVADSASNRKLNYFNNDLSRRIASLGLPSTALNAELGTKTALDNYGRTGLNRALDTMGWWNIGTSQAANAVSSNNQPNTAWGESLSNLGAGIAGAGLIGLKDYWSKPKPVAEPITSTNPEP